MSLSLEHAQLMSIGDLASASAADLQHVQDEASESLRKSKALKDWIDGAVALKYEQRAQAIRQEQGKDAGKVHFVDDGIEMTSSFPNARNGISKSSLKSPSASLRQAMTLLSLSTLPTRFPSANTPPGRSTARRFRASQNSENRQAHFPS